MSAKFTNGLKVFVDGIEVRHVRQFNVAEGWVECYVTSKSGYSNQTAVMEEFLTSKLYGHIEVEE